MANIVKVVKEMSSVMKKLEDKEKKDENSEIQDILERQKVIDKKLVETFHSIKRLEKGISKLENQKEKRDEKRLIWRKLRLKPKKQSKNVNTKTEDFVNI